MLYIENKSNDGFSKRLYGFPSSAILLDRMNLSARNGWLDEEGFHDLAEQFRGVAAIEKMHEERYRKLLSNVETMQAVSYTHLTLPTICSV